MCEDVKEQLRYKKTLLPQTYNTAPSNEPADADEKGANGQSIKDKADDATT